MNLIVLEDQDFISAGEVQLRGRRHLHLIEVLKAIPGHRLCVGRLNGKLGIGRITEILPDATRLTIEHLQDEPPPMLPLTLILGLPRPRMLQRTLQNIATMGVERLCLIHTSRVEKSFWQTPLLRHEAVHEQLLLGLEQGKATQLPQLEIHQRFLPFIEDRLPQLCHSARRLIAHPGPYPTPERSGDRRTVLAVGPEGGFVDNEIAHFQRHGFAPVQLGQRILRVETAVPVLLAKLF